MIVSRISICLLFGLTPTAFGGSTEVFHLIKGLQQVYHYHALDYSWSFSQYTSVTDSGLAECTLMDSATVDDTTIAWTVVEKRNVNRHTVATSPPVDTVYAMSDSTTCILHEYATGYHELRSASLVWEFPVSFSNGQTFPVFRYSDSARVVSAFGFGCMRFAGVDYDTLWFSADSGLFKRAYSRCYDRDFWGSATWRNVRLISRVLVSVGGADPLPAHLVLHQNHPNPFNPTTMIEYTIAGTRGQGSGTSNVKLVVYDLLGREVAVLVNEQQAAGSYSVTFDASGLGSGVYFYRLSTGKSVFTRKAVLQK